MKTLIFDIKEYTDINSMIKSRFGYCKLQRRLISIEELEIVAKKYQAEFDIDWVYDYKENRSVANSFIMKMEEHMYNAYLISEI